MIRKIRYLDIEGLHPTCPHDNTPSFWVPSFVYVRTWLATYLNNIGLMQRSRAATSLLQHYCTRILCINRFQGVRAEAGFQIFY